uniref:hypothetical protein n=1 Tax=Castellaniella defragrans TaxID=75697 RepID=UPI0033400D2E
MTESGSRFFDAEFLRQLEQRARDDAFVARHGTLANVRLGIRDSGSGEFVRLHVRADGLVIDRQSDVSFTLVGDAGALQALSQGFPFNRLVRQHRLFVEGDLRSCVQNWLLIHAVLRLCQLRGE